MTDSTTDLPRELLNQYDIEVIPLSIFVDGESFLDTVTISPDEFIQRMIASNELPKTSQPAVGAFLETYDRLGANGDTIISIHMTGGMSGTYATACAAAEMSESRVEVIDSQMISQALGFQVLEAARLAREGSTVDAIVARVKEIFEQTSLFVVVETLENLIKGGRIGKAAGLLGTILKIKPIAMLQQGVYSPVAKVRTSSQIVRTLMERFESDIKGKIVRGVGISHADNLPLAERLQQEIARFTSIPVRICTTTPIISTHTGPGAIGFSYYAE
ncbi:DegV family protein with EDD domain [Paenibacillus methanolicus]|uniref:DegV family protein with EDD domain n=1 Tax=Paenibacillus methanolicus TaxID=582686 RepID=A0A5S5CM68_9BACL|nr:DegV family protein with EDD domain [Paenibacillus methanolicus]